ncbi:MAG: efflux RND transporter periplasmic adaptor subunit [Isosphaeraceae bacterium]
MITPDEISDRAATGFRAEGPYPSAQSTAPKQRRRGIWKFRFKQIGQALLAAAAIGAFVYWMRFAPVPVEVSPVERGEIVAEVMGTGTLEARVKVTVSSKITGRLTTITVDQGDHVKVGQVLARLDDSDFTRQVETEEATVSARNASIERLRAEVAHAQAVLDLATSNYQRASSLMARKAISVEEFDKYREEMAIARSGLAQSQAGLIEGHGQLRAATKNREYHRARLADTVITAPFDGLVLRRDRDPGDILVPGSSLLLVASTAEIWVSAWVDETEMARLAPGRTARIVFRSEPDHTYPGTVARLGREVDRETREFVVDVHVDQLPDNWAVGQRADVFIEIARKTGVLRIPAAQVAQREGKPGVFVARDGRAWWRPLELGLRGIDSVEVNAGLNEGDSIIVPPGREPLNLRDGQRVRPR